MSDRTAEQRRIRRRRSTVQPIFVWVVLHSSGVLELSDGTPCLYRTRRGAQMMAARWLPSKPVRAVVMILPEKRR